MLERTKANVYVKKKIHTQLKKSVLWYNYVIPPFIDLFTVFYLNMQLTPHPHFELSRWH